MFFTETHGGGLGLVVHVPSNSSDVRFPLKKLFQMNHPFNLFVGLLTEELP